ncbi:MAG: NAD(+) synthase [Pseudoflavonifractor sp.]|nr:NAD(+) synthase [Alloprevotella sp.]MCM1115931.1 NAD(+) synthase [Pseudoflavonifractor sp.]
MTNGFLRVASAVPPVNVADVKANVEGIIALAAILAGKGVELTVMPEMCLTGYTCADLFHSSTLLRAAAEGLEQIREASLQWPGMALAVGVPVSDGTALHNCAALIAAGEVKLMVAKEFLPTYNEFYERRWWAPGPEGQTRLIPWAGALIGMEICEELWTPEPPSGKMAMSGAHVIVNLSASDDLIGKYDYLRSLVTGQSGRCICGYAYASAGYGESTTDLVYSGKALIAERGSLLAENNRWDTDDRYVIADIDIEAIERDRIHTSSFASSARAAGIAPLGQCLGERIYDPEKLPDYRYVDPRPFVPADQAGRDSRCNEIANIQTAGLRRRLEAIHARSLTIGVSGGLDSTLALLVAVRAFDSLSLPREGIIGVTMPGFGTTGRTLGNSRALMQGLGITIREIPISEAVMLHFRDIGHDPETRDVTYENCQARERTQILMDIANQTGGIVLGTGDLSELALGWATYNGDHMSMYGVNVGVPKTLVRHMVEWFASVARRAGDTLVADTLDDICATPVSPELLPPSADGQIAQKTEDTVGPYLLHDFFLYYTLRFGFSPRRIYILARKAFAETERGVVLKWMRVFFRRFFAQQFKRSCLPDGPKVGSVCLSPRGDWRMPSDASAALWLAEIESLS